MQYPYGWEFARFTHCCERAPNMEELIKKHLLNLSLCYFLCTCLSTSHAWEDPQRRARMFSKREVKLGRVKACTRPRSRQNRCSSLAMGWWVGPGTVNTEGPSEGPIFLYCWSEGWGVETVSTGMSRVRWGLSMASPCESKWCPIKFVHLYTPWVTYQRVLGGDEPGSAQPQTKQVLESGGSLPRRSLLRTG